MALRAFSRTPESIVETAPRKNRAAQKNKSFVEKSPTIFFPRHRHKLKSLNLALQGGGAHGAFTWGVLDCLLDRTDYALSCISGTSTGAINAVSLACGYMEDGPEGARRKLDEVWRAVNKSHCYVPGKRRLYEGEAPLPRHDLKSAEMFFRALTRVFSPYEFNPLEIDPLRNILRDRIDFDALGRHSPIQLFINATEVSSGRGRLFSGDEITLDSVLASACLPTFKHAVEIEGEHYWDGGFSANPPIMPLIEHSQVSDTMIVRLTSDHTDEVPVKVEDIQGSMQRLMFSQPLRKEIELIEMARRMVNGDKAKSDPLASRVAGHRFHLLDGAKFTSMLHSESAMSPDWDVLAYLNQSGRKATTNWLKRHTRAVGEKSTIDLAQKFL